MTKTARSLYVWSVYVLLVGALVALAPNDLAGSVWTVRSRRADAA